MMQLAAAELTRTSPRHAGGGVQGRDDGGGGGGGDGEGGRRRDARASKDAAPWSDAMASDTPPSPTAAGAAAHHVETGPDEAGRDHRTDSSSSSDPRWAHKRRATAVRGRPNQALHVPSRR